MCFLAACGSAADAENPAKAPAAAQTKGKGKGAAIACDRLLTKSDVDAACVGRGATITATPYETGDGIYTCNRTIKVPRESGSPATYTFKVSRYASAEQVREMEDPGTYDGDVQRYQKLSFGEGAWSFKRGERFSVGAVRGDLFVGIATSYQDPKRPSCAEAALQSLAQKVVQRLE